MTAEVNRASIAEPLFQWDDDGVVRERVSLLDEVLGRMGRQLRDAYKTPWEEVAKRQAALAGMAAAAAELESLVNQLADRLAELSGLRLPAMGPQWSYDVTVRVSEAVSETWRQATPTSTSST